jgi:hypothetical protein
VRFGKSLHFHVTLTLVPAQTPVKFLRMTDVSYLRCLSFSGYNSLESPLLLPTSSVSPLSYIPDLLPPLKYHAYKIISLSQHSLFSDDLVNPRDDVTLPCTSWQPRVTLVASIKMAGLKIVSDQIVRCSVPLASRLTGLVSNCMFQVTLAINRLCSSELSDRSRELLATS